MASKRGGKENQENPLPKTAQRDHWCSQREKLSTSLWFESRFWTTAMLADFIEKTYKVQYKSRTSYYPIFKRVKFTHHKPGRIYERQDKEQIEVWRREAKPRIKKVLT